MAVDVLTRFWPDVLKSTAQLSTDPAPRTIVPGMGADRVNILQLLLPRKAPYESYDWT